jgi:hypothetical protein
MGEAEPEVEEDQDRYDPVQRTGDNIIAIHG